ncbi:ATP-binding protein [Flavilitoribacter nigricans]|uniref:histidine kinase n=1 Tax=Flavilitoribacter nigricans (strain ATCC 23147 / DSM 23189 / NBRC 102662 / NCIMB 1420 / SS-2) TaxID=1122177 RepID=A0A2D0NH87_FLAN2|nr:ATP-binding protein [Flavilitoribacter nigricans]PHN07847.1 hypothetical protein CRP01_03600 [Flavilitoribacter nigricans DSM 23189 = NBRC 102662]
MLRNVIFLVLLLTLVSCDGPDQSAVAYQPAQVMVNDQLLTFQDSVNILPYAALLPPDGSPLNYERVVARRRAGAFEAPGSYPTLIRSKQEYWLTFTLANPRETTTEFILYFGPEQYLELYGLEEVARMGNMVPARERTGAFLPGFFIRDDGHSAQAKIQLAAGESRELFVKIRRVINKPMALRLKVFQPEFWSRRIDPGRRHLGQAFFQGIIWALLLYHLLLFLMIRDLTYLYYCLYILMISLLTLGDFGYLQSVLLKEQPYFAWGLFLLMQYATGIMTFKFMQSFVQLRQLLPVWNRRVNLFIRINLVILATVSVLYLLTRDYLVVQLTQPLLVPFALAGLLICYLLIRTRDQVALYFAIAGVIFTTAIIINGLLELLSNKDLILESSYSRYYILEITAIIHLFTFSIGLGYRRRMKDLESQRSLEIGRIKNRFYANITHEFRTPLTVIMGLSEQINGYPREQKLIRRNGKHLLRLINQLLDLSKLESGKLEVHPVCGDIVAYLRYLTESFDSMAMDKGIKLTFYSEEDAFLMDYDDTQIQHIVYNLLSNAIKFTPDNGKVILHVVSTERDGRPYLQIKVKDTGIGIAEQQFSHIFDRFYQVDSSSTRRGEGTGIGLSLTSELVHLLGGEIDVASKEGQGSTFKVFIPITKTAPRASQSTAPIAPSEEMDRPELKGTAARPDSADLPQLLLIEDNPDLQEYIQNLLRETYMVHTAGDGQRGIELAIELIPDVIISDVMMPEKNGYEVCEVLKQDERTSHIPIILLTAKAAQRDKIKGLQYGADAYLTKPFDSEELFVRLEKLIQLRRELQAHFAPDRELVNTNGRHPQEEAFLQKLRSELDERISDPDFGVRDLAQSVGMSHTQMYRKIKALTGKTPSSFIRSARLQRGREFLQSTDLNVSEIAYEVGFADPNYFSRTFLQEFHTSPSDFRK